MDEISIDQFESIEFKINTKYKGTIKEELKERAMLSLQYFIMFCIFIGFTITAVVDQFDIFRYEALKTAAIILLCLADVSILLAALFAPFFVTHNRGMNGKIRFNIYKNDNNEFKCRCIGNKRKRLMTFDEQIKSIKIEKYSIRIYYKDSKFFRIPLSQLDKMQIEKIKKINQYLRNK